MAAICPEFADRAIMEQYRVAAMVMWRDTELCNRATDRHVRLHRSYGHMRLCCGRGPRAAAFTLSIYGGTSEIMKTIIARDLTRLRT